MKMFSKHNREVEPLDVEGLSFPEVVEPKIYEANSEEIKSLDTYANSFSPEEIKKLKNDYQIDFYKPQSPEIFCYQLETVIAEKIKLIKELSKNYESEYYYQKPLNIELETNDFNKIKESSAEIEQLLTDYKLYIDAINPETAKAYDIPDKLTLRIYGDKYQKVENLLEVLKHAEAQFGENNRRDYELAEKPISSFFTLREVDKETKEINYKLFIKDDTLLKKAGEKTAVNDNKYEAHTKNDSYAIQDLARYTPGYGSLENYLKGRKHLQLYVIAKLIQLYDLPELADRKVDFEEFIKAIQEKLKEKEKVQLKPGYDVYNERRDFFNKEKQIISVINSHSNAYHQINQTQSIDNKIEELAA